MPPPKMTDMKEFPKRKHPRLKEYDYSQPGFYYVTIHIAENGPLLSTVGRGLAPAEAAIRLTQTGRIVYRQLLALEKRYGNVCIDRYVIMPTHVHVIVRLKETAGASPRPTLMDVVRTYKSLVTRECNSGSKTPGRRIFQTSFYETVLRNEAAYMECCRYIDENPVKWLLKGEV